MIDTYISADSLESMIAFTAEFSNMIGPVKGIQERGAATDEDGNVIEAREAVGDSSKLYACVRSDKVLTLPVGIAFIDAALGAQIVGVWA